MGIYSLGSFIVRCDVGFVTKRGGQSVHAIVTLTTRYNYIKMCVCVCVCVSVCPCLPFFSTTAAGMSFKHGYVFR